MWYPLHGHIPSHLSFGVYAPKLNLQVVWFQSCLQYPQQLCKAKHKIEWNINTDLRNLHIFGCAQVLCVWLGMWPLDWWSGGAAVNNNSTNGRQCRAHTGAKATHCCIGLWAMTAIYCTIDSVFLFCFSLMYSLRTLSSIFPWSYIISFYIINHLLAPFDRLYLHCGLCVIQYPISFQMQAAVVLWKFSLHRIHSSLESESPNRPGIQVFSVDLLCSYVYNHNTFDTP